MKESSSRLSLTGTDEGVERKAIVNDACSMPGAQPWALPIKVNAFSQAGSRNQQREVINSNYAIRAYTCPRLNTSLPSPRTGLHISEADRGC